jgi:hypothetical protein
MRVARVIQHAYIYVVSYHSRYGAPKDPPGFSGAQGTVGKETQENDVFRLGHALCGLTVPEYYSIKAEREARQLL